jgi:hypothetical protein
VTPASDVTVVVAGEGELHFRSTRDARGVWRDLRGLVQLEKTPVLEWSWRVVSFPQSVRPGTGVGASLEDRAIRLGVVWFGATSPVTGQPNLSTSRAIAYVWDSTAPAGTIIRKQTVGSEIFIVVRSGSADLGQWVSERRNIFEDFQAFFGERPHDPASIWIGVRSTRALSGAELFVGPIAFRAP